VELLGAHILKSFAAAETREQIFPGISARHSGRLLAGIQPCVYPNWIPAFAGMTEESPLAAEKSMFP
jgi:hypothetical protein